MRILALQLKRIGDLVLTTPALAALKEGIPGAEVVLAVHSSTSSLLPAISSADSTVVFGPGRGWTPWQQVLTGGFDVVLDFTGTDRSALATFLARAKRTITFDWVRKKRLRALMYREFVASSVRDRHTVDHYLDLLRPLGVDREGLSPSLSVPATEENDYVVLHPGTARPEKFWLADRWAEVGRHLIEQHGLRVVITTGKDPAELAHVQAIQSAISNPKSETAQTATLCDFTTLLGGAKIVVSCDTAAVHIAAAFGRPQIALFGPTNPYHWRPRHEQARVISAAKPDEPLTVFDPRMKGAPMDRISTATVCRAIDALLCPSLSA